MGDHAITYDDVDEVFRCTDCGLVQPSEDAFSIFACRSLLRDEEA